MSTDTFLAFDFGGTKVDIGIGTTDGTLVGHERLWVRDYPTAESLVEAAIARGCHLSGPHQVAAVGVSTMGITYADHVELAPNVPGWADLQLPRLFSDTFRNQPTVIENDVRAACHAEVLWGSLRAQPAAAYLNLGTGIGMAFVFGGHVWAGVHGAAGEIAYLWERDEPGYSAGRAPFEERFGGGGLDTIIATKFPPFNTLNDLFTQSVPGAEKFLRETFHVIARRVGHVLLALDVGVVAVGGGVSKRFETIAPTFEEEWRLHLPYPPRLVASRFRHEAGLYGALALAVQGGTTT